MNRARGDKYNPGNKQFLVGHAIKTFIDVVAQGRDPEPLVHTLHGLLKTELEDQKFSEAMDQTRLAEKLWDKTDGEQGISPRQASYERFGHYVNLAERRFIIKQKPTPTDDDAGEYLLSGARGREDEEEAEVEA